MFGSRQSGASAYANIGMETGVAAASPHKLIVMLFDGALQAVANGLAGMRSGDLTLKGKSISHASLIIDSGLRAALDKKAGGEIAEGLDALYQYMGERLVAANLKNDAVLLLEVQRLLTELRDAWNAIADAPAVTGQNAAPSTTPIPKLVSA